MRHLRFRFSLQALLVALLVSGLFLGLWVNRARRQREAVKWIEQQGGHISYDYERPTADGSYPVGAKPPGPPWLREWLGIEYFAVVEGVILDRDEVTNIEPLAKLPRLRSLAFMIEVDPELDFSPLYRCKRLESLHLEYTGLEPTQLRPFQDALPNCKIYSSEYQLRLVREE